MATHYPHAATGTLAVADRSIVLYASVVRFFKREQNDAMEDRDGERERLPTSARSDMFTNDNKILFHRANTTATPGNGGARGLHGASEISANRNRDITAPIDVTCAHCLVVECLR